MVWFKRSSHSLILATALTLGLAVHIPEGVQAKLGFTSPNSQLPEPGENYHQTIPSPETLVSSSYTPPRPPGGPTPVNTVSGGRRSGTPCIAKSDGLPIPLVPVSNMGKTAVAQTVAEYPTISWYLPKITATTQEPAAVEFILTDENDQTIYSTSYALAQSNDDYVEAGIMSLTIPPFAKIPPLEIGKEYSWQLNVMCAQSDNSSVKYKSEKIRLKRVALDPVMASRIQEATPQERFALYQEADVWYDSLNTMLELLQQNPNDQELASAWDKLLKSVGR
ncbi:MAG: DUF928 domain-containing protein [Symploca sp. SIO3E6]|nr:DUF928 domain-containing protein [Caldora sp. SIO3E6]